MKRLTSVLVFCVSIVLSAFSQSNVVTGQIRGRVVDSSGAAIPQASVSVRNADTGINESVSTDELGNYRLLILPPGEYEIRVEREGFTSKVQKKGQVTIGQILTLNFQLEVGAVTTSVDVTETVPLIESERTQQETTIEERYIRQLPIDRRDYLTYALLAPGIADSVAMADANDYRSVVAASSGLSFFGSNGRGNSIQIDGGEVNNDAGGIRETVSQEAVREFQINRGNYSAELGSASGGVINIVSKSGTKAFHGSAFAFFRDQHVDAADPFARTFIDGVSTRIKPPSNRQQFGGTLGGPINPNKTFFFAAFEGLERHESISVPVLTDKSIFEPTPEQTAILATLPPETAAQLRETLTAPASTRALFEVNNGIFPFDSNDYKFSIRLDHRLSGSNQLFYRYNYAGGNEKNPNTGALVGVTRGIQSSSLDHTSLLRWTHTFNTSTINQLHFQFNYSDLLVSTNDKYGPELNIVGYGLFNRDRLLPSNNIARRYEINDDLSISRNHFQFHAGGQLLLRGIHAETQALFGGTFFFGPVAVTTLDDMLISTTLTAVQAFSLGMPNLYNQGFGDPVVASTNPFYAGYVQSSWKARKSLTLDFGGRYELDSRLSPLPTDKNNFAPRFGFAWDPRGNGKATVRGGYGIFYSPTYYFVDWVVNALNEINGKRQIAQVFTTGASDPAATPANIYQTLRQEGVITLPLPTRSIAVGDLEQFGIHVAHEGPIPQNSVLFRNSRDFVNPYSQQASLGLEHSIGPDWLLSLNYEFARTLKLARSRDDNLLPAPINSHLGIPVWSNSYFKRPELLQDDVYESTARAFYHGFTAEVKRRLSGKFSLDFNYTLSKAIDEGVDYNSNFAANDQLNLRAERALSSFDQRHKFVAYGTVVTPFDLTVTPIFRANSARPFNLLAGSDLNGDHNPYTDRPAFAGRNTGIGPAFWSADVRVGRTLRIGDKGSLEMMAEAFNVFNRLNFKSINNTVGNISGPFDLHGREDRTPSQPLGFTSAFEARRLQLGVRLSF